MLHAIYSDTTFFYRPGPGPNEPLNPSDMLVLQLSIVLKQVRWYGSYQPSAYDYAHSGTLVRQLPTSRRACWYGSCQLQETGMLVRQLPTSNFKTNRYAGTAATNFKTGMLVRQLPKLPRRVGWYGSYQLKKRVRWYGSYQTSCGYAGAAATILTKQPQASTITADAASAILLNSFRLLLLPLTQHQPSY